jgi:hypothetical protein
MVVLQCAAAQYAVHMLVMLHVSEQQRFANIVTAHCCGDSCNDSTVQCAELVDADKGPFTVHKLATNNIEH